MSFRDLKVDELAKVAEFFVVDVEAASDKPTKKELIAALNSGDDPVTWEQYTDIYLKAEVPDDLTEEVPVGKPVKATEPTEEVDTSDYVLVKYDRKNPTYQVVGYSFSKRHPFVAVPPEIAEYLILRQEGFRQALPSEVAEYYK